MLSEFTRDGGSILIYLSECEQEHYQPLIRLGLGLKAAGHKVHFLLCSHGPCSGCHNIFNEVTDYYCVFNRAQLLKSLQEHDQSPLFLSDFYHCDSPQDDELVQGAELFRRFPDVEWDGFRLGEIIRGTAYRYLQRTTIEADDDRVVRSLFSTAKQHIRAFQAVCDTLAPDLVILFNGMTLPDHTARLVAQRRGIPVVAEENSCFSDRKFLDPGGVVLNRHEFSRIETWSKIRGQHLSEEKKEQLTSYFAGVFEGRGNTVAQRRPESMSSVRTRLGFDPKRPLALLLGQVPFDSVIAYDSPHYQHFLDFVTDAINYFARHPDWGLVLRLHPLEAVLYGSPTSRALPLPLPENVRLVQGREFNTYDLMDCCRFGMTINSQSGLEMLAKHKPVLVAGDAFYGGKGFTSDLAARDQLEMALNELMENPVLNPMQKEWIDRFLYAFLFEYLVPFDRTENRFGPEALKRIEEHIAKRGAKNASSQAPLRVDSSAWKEVQYHYLDSVKLREERRFCEALEALDLAIGVLEKHDRLEEGGRIIEDRLHLLQELEDKEGIAAELIRVKPLVELEGGSLSLEFLLALAWSCFNTDDRTMLDRVLGLIDGKAAKHPAWIKIQFEMALRSSSKGCWEDAEKRLFLLLDCDPKDLDYLFHWARAYKHLNKVDYKSWFSEAAKDRLNSISVHIYFLRILKTVVAGKFVDASKGLIVLGWFLFNKALSLGKPCKP